MNHTDHEQQWDKLLNIKTSGRDASISNYINYPYEPTPYDVLERLANSGFITKKNVVLDFGCGKGRVDFFLSYQLRCRAIGIDYDERMIQAAIANREKAAAGARTEFFCGNAMEYEVPEDVDRCFFFNPFSEEVLIKVLARIKDSYYRNPREMILFFYYPSDEYIGRLMMDELLIFSDEVDCGDLFPGGDERERIMVFEVNP